MQVCSNISTHNGFLKISKRCTVKSTVSAGIELISVQLIFGEEGWVCGRAGTVVRESACDPQRASDAQHNDLLQASAAGARGTHAVAVGSRRTTIPRLPRRNCHRRCRTLSSVSISAIVTEHLADKQTRGQVIGRYCPQMAKTTVRYNLKLSTLSMRLHNN